MINTTKGLDGCYSYRLSCKRYSDNEETKIFDINTHKANGKINRMYRFIITEDDIEALIFTRKGPVIFLDNNSMQNSGFLELLTKVVNDLLLRELIKSPIGIEEDFRGFVQNILDSIYEVLTKNINDTLKSIKGEIP